MDAPERPIVAEWIAASYRVGNYSELQILPMLVAARIRNTIGSTFSSQLVADAFIALLFLIAFVYFLLRALRGTFVVTRDLLHIVGTAPLTVLSFFGLLVSGVLLWFVYRLSAVEFPREHDAIYQIIAVACAVVVDFFVRISGLFLRSIPGG